MTLDKFISSLYKLRSQNTIMRNRLEQISPRHVLAYYDGVVTAYTYVIHQLEEEKRKEKEFQRQDSNPHHPTKIIDVSLPT